MTPKVFIAGSGGIGKAAGLILTHATDFDTDIVFGDLHPEVTRKAVEFVGDASHLSEVTMPQEGASQEMEDVLDSCDILLDCLPGSQAPRMARLARKHHCHYANLTEYVDETNQVIEIAEGADTAFVLQTGLAPGFINVLACKLYEEFVSEYGVDILDSMSMKVGALSKHAVSPHFYAFTWSPIGVATEYLRNAYIVRDFEKVTIPALSGRKTIIIAGDEYEDNFTSGGAADLPEAFAGKIQDLDYKTLRYPGHYAWVEAALTTIPHDENRVKELERIMLHNIPSVEDDRVIIYASVAGKDKSGRLRRKEKSYEIEPCEIGGRSLRAIQSSTAGALCEVALMLLKEKRHGIIKQSMINPGKFLNGNIISQIYGPYDK
jgi:saccharopine dehydrogenase-like NADP-dependent oxidoreductase